MLGDFLVKALRKPAEAASKATGLFSKLLQIGKKKEEPEPVKKINTKEIYVLKTDEKGHANFITMKCCSPIPGDDTMGFINENDEVELHSLDCPRAQALKASYGPKIVATRWENDGAKFMAHIHIEGVDRRGLLQELTQMISTHLAIDIRKLDIEASAEIFTCDLWVRVTSADVVRDLCDKTLSIEGIKSSTRIQ